MSKKYFFIVGLLMSCMATACGGDDKEDDKKEPQQPVIEENTIQRCSDLLDNDGDGKIDCEDDECSKGFTFCQNIDLSKEESPSTCSDGIDNDNNGKQDCDEAFCKNFTLCKEAEPENTKTACEDGLDNDKDGAIDAKDSDCAEFYKQEDKVENTNELCHDNTDNDDDGKTDCDDSDCAAFCGSGPVSQKENSAALCSDDIDNDNNGKKDCQETSCLSFDVCASYLVRENTRELCSDDIDNDLDGTKDCSDKNCQSLDICTSGGETGEDSPEKCKNGNDDDTDGKVDCADPECSYYDVCNGLKNAEDDECPNDPYKWKKDDGCDCGMTKVGDSCYINISSVGDLEKLENSSDNYIIKRPFNLGNSRTAAPITGFSGILDGQNMRITGNLAQEATLNKTFYECGLFGATESNPTFRNIRLAIRLDCQDNRYSGSTDPTIGIIHVGGLVSNTEGTIQNVSSESKIMLKSKMPSDKLWSSSQYGIYVGGIVGLHNSNGKMNNIEVSGNTSAQIEWSFADMSIETSQTRDIYIGGVVGNSYVSKISNVNSSSTNVSLEYKLSNSPKDSEIFMGGIAGKAVVLDTCNSNDSTVFVSHNNEKGKSGSNINYSHYIGGLVGQVHRVARSSFAGTLVSAGKEGAQAAQAVDNKKNAYQGTNIGGIAGGLLKNDGNTTDKVSIVNSSVNADMSLITGTGIYAGGLLGRMGNVKNDSSTEEYYIANCHSNVDLMLTPGASKDFYWGGAVAEAAENGYVLNSHLRTDYKVDEFTVADAEGLTLGGIVSKYAGVYINNSNTSANIAKDEYGGNLVNNFVSGGPVAAEGSENIGKFRSAMAATYGYYIYETYWDGDIYGMDIKAATQSTKADATAKPYQYSADHIPLLSSGDRVLGKLRKNSGHDGGVMSTWLPTTLDYSDWTEVVDEDGNRVPVPVIE